MLMKNALEYLEQSARRLPDKTAFADEEEALTFRRLWERSLALGTLLARRTGAVNRPVAVLSDRTAESVAALQGVLASGNYYVPLDNRMPPPRLEAILSRLKPAAVLYGRGDEKLAASLSGWNPLSFAEGWAETGDEELLAERRRRVLDIDPAYVIFTSGSTGIPKGIVISHRSLIDFTEWMADFCGIREDDVLGNQAPFHFDLSVKDLYLTLKCGATAEILPKKLFLFPLPLLQYMDEHRVTALIWATSAFHLVANSGALEKCAPACLRLAALGGEALQARQLNRWRAALPGMEFINLYGPTEVTVDCTACRLDRPYADDEPIPIGTACANMEVQLLDEQLRPVADGQPGEICVRGIGLARGYFGDWDKTRAAFVQNPANPDYPDLLYRTGDLAVRGKDGLLYFSARRDGQIKHMGYRIELGEIETALSALPEVDMAVCLYDAPREKILCVYAGDPDFNAIARQLRARLPKYMQPNVYHWMDKLPMNANGKIDRPALKERYLHGTNP